MKRSLILFGIFLTVVGLLPAEEVLPETNEKAVLAIHIDNGTAGGQVAEGTAVTVNFYQGQELIKQASSVTDSHGNCIIEDIPESTGVVAVAQAKHSDMAFSSSPLQLKPGQKRYDLSFQVFDVAYDNSLIRIGTHHLILKKSGGTIHISEYIQLINDSDRAVLSDKEDEEGRPEVIWIGLPENAKDLSFSSYFHPDAIVRTQTGFYDTMAIPPGSYHAVFSYDIPLSADAIDFAKSITFPTKSMMVFVQTDSGVMTELGEPEGQMALADGALANYYTVDVSPGSVLTFHVEGVTIPKPQPDVWLVPGIVFSVIVVIALFRMIKQRPAV